MATRRRPNEPTPFTQVVARPVDTSVTPGSAGMPQAPVAPIAPTPVSNQGVLDLQNLASSLGQFSRSLADLGMAQKQFERREDQEQRRLEAERQAKLDRADRLRKEAEALSRRDRLDAEREASRLEEEARKLGTKIANLVDLTGVNTIRELKGQFDKLLDADEISISEHPAYSEAFSIALAKRFAEQDFLRDQDALDRHHQKAEDETKNPNWFTKWYSGKTEDTISSLPDWIPDKDAFSDAYLQARNTKSDRLIVLHSRFLKKEQLTTEQTNLEVDVHEALSSMLEDEKLNASVTANEITSLLDAQRRDGLSSASQAKQIVSNAFLSFIKTRESSDEIDDLLEVLELIQTGPEGTPSRSAFLSGEIKVNFDNEILPEIRRIQDNLDKQQVAEVFNANVNFLNGQFLDSFTQQIQQEGFNVERLVDGGSQKLREILNLKGTPSQEDLGIYQILKSLNARVEGNSLTISSGEKTATIDLQKIAEESMRIAVSKDMVLTLAQVKKNKLYENFSPANKELIARALSIRNLNANASSIKTEVERLLTGDYGSNVEEGVENLKAALEVYRALRGNKDSNPNLAKDVLGSDNLRLLQIVLKLNEQDQYPSLKNINILFGKIRDGSFSKEIIDAKLGDSFDGSSTVQDEIKNQISKPENIAKLSSVLGASFGGRAQPRFQVIQLARIFYAVGGVKPKEAVNMAMAALQEDLVEVEGSFFPAELLTQTTSTGDSPLMRKNPNWIPPTTEEKQARKEQQKKRKEHEENLKNYYEILSKSAGVRVSFQQFTPPEPASYGERLSELQNKLRRGEVDASYLEPFLTDGKGNFVSPDIRRTDGLLPNSSQAKLYDKQNEYLDRVENLTRSGNYKDGVEQKRLLMYLHKLSLGSKTKTVRTTDAFGFRTGSKTVPVDTIPPNAWRELGFEDPSGMRFKRHMQALEKAGLIETNKVNEFKLPRLLGDPTKKRYVVDYQAVTPAKLGKFEAKLTKEFLDYSSKLFNAENKLRVSEGLRPLPMNELSRRIGSGQATKVPNNPFPVYESTVDFEVDVLRQDPGNFSGVELLRKATKAVRMGTAIVGEKGVASDIYKEILNNANANQRDSFVIVPVPGLIEGGTKSAMNRFVVKVKRFNSSVLSTVDRDNTNDHTYSTEEIVALARAFENTPKEKRVRSEFSFEGSSYGDSRFKASMGY
tara:strand:+ start:3361 stop:6897 length:3537 start_codon:yes stop_codon:yes gene_type:complete